MRTSASMTTKVERGPIESKAKVGKEFDNGNVNVQIGKRQIKIPAEVVKVLKGIQHCNDAINYYCGCSWLVAGPDNCQHKKWERAGGDPRFCEPYVTVADYVEIVAAFGCRESETLRSFAGLHLLPRSECFRQWRSNNHPARASIKRASHMSQRLNRDHG